MLRIAMEEISPSSRYSVDTPPRKSSSLLFSSFVFDGLSRQSFSYNKLPDEPLKLCIRKLDGSCFDIEVMKTATISELKQAVEAVFSHMPKKGPGKISWPHVWGHFCLCFEGQKLVTDADYISNYGIRDGDQLQFIRHISTSYYNMRKVQSKRHSASSKQRDIYWIHDRLSSRSFSYKAKEEELKDKEEYETLVEMENGSYHHFDNKDKTVDGQQNESRLFYLLRGWLSYSRLVAVGQKGNSCPSRYACGVLCSFRKIIQLYDGKHYSRRSVSRED